MPLGLSYPLSLFDSFSLAQLGQNNNLRRALPWQLENGLCLQFERGYSDLG